MRHISKGEQRERCNFNKISLYITLIHKLSFLTFKCIYNTSVLFNINKSFKKLYSTYDFQFIYFHRYKCSWIGIKLDTLKYNVLILRLLIYIVLRGQHSRDCLNQSSTVYKLVLLCYSVLLHVGSVSSFFNSISFLFMVY